MGKESNEESKGVKKVIDRIFYKKNRKERIRNLSKDFVEDLDTLILEKDGIVDQTKATKDVVQMELELERAELEAWERGTKIFVTIGTFAVGAYFMKKSFDLNQNYMMLCYQQKDSMNFVDPGMKNAFLKSKDNFTRMADNSLNGFKGGIYK